MPNQLSVQEITHDINNLLCIVTHKFEAMSNADPAQILELAQHAEISIKQASTVCGDLITGLTSYQSNNQVCSMNQILLEMLPLSRTFIGGNSELSIVLGGCGQFTVADLGLLKRAIVNLVQNADQAARSNVVVRSFTEEMDTPDLNPYWPSESSVTPGIFVGFSVKDDGPGVETEMINRIFQPYVSTKKEGQGLGLATVLRAVRKNNGIVRVDSEPGNTIFTVCFPACGPSAGFCDKRITVKLTPQRGV